MNIGDTYVIRIEVEGRLFTYTGKILEVDDQFITFEDKYGKTFSYNKSNIISFEEVKE